MEQELIEFSNKHPTLGPNYEFGRQVSERFMAQFETEQLLPLIETFGRKVYEEVEQKFRDFLMTDVECNIHLDIQRQLDACVEALLGKNTWIIEKYCLGERYNCEQIRAAVAAAMPKEIQEARIADLEAEIERLKNDIAIMRQYR